MILYIIDMYKINMNILEICTKKLIIQFNVEQCVLSILVLKIKLLKY